MPRTSGAKNKPKFINVKVEDIIRLFNPSTVIKIDAGYGSFFDIKESSIEVSFPEKEDEDSFEMKIT